MEVLSSGKHSFKVEVPYKLFETGKSGPKPLIVYLHGAGQNIETFEKLTKELHVVEAYHLYIQGPYADTATVKHRGKWGFLWYLYNGKQGSFIKSLEYTSEFIQGVVDTITRRLEINRLCVLGYSMGAYQAGYFGLSRWKHTNDLIVVSGRIKHEAFTESRLARCRHMNVLGWYGRKDEVLSAEEAGKGFDVLKKNGISCRFTTHAGGHKLDAAVLKQIRESLKEIGYSVNTRL